MAKPDITKQLQEKSTGLKAEFQAHKDRVGQIDNLITKLQNEKMQERDNMIRTQGAYMVIEDILKSKPAKVNDNKKHGKTPDIQS